LTPDLTQLDPSATPARTQLVIAWVLRLKHKHNEALSNFAFNFKLRHYGMVDGIGDDVLDLFLKDGLPDDTEEF